MKTNRLAKIVGVGLLSVFCLPTVAQAQDRLVKAGYQAVSKTVSKTGFIEACKEAGCPRISVAELAGKIEKAVVEGAKASKASAEIGKTVQATGMSEVKGVTTASKAARQAQEGVNGLRQPQAPKVKAPATHYYSMANNAEEIPTPVQKVEPLKTDKLLELYNNDAPEWKEIFWKTTDLRKPEIAAELDELMARHPEILNNPEYAKEDVVTLIGTPAAPYTADQIAMVAAIENKPQWIIYAYRRAGYVGNAVYYALKNGHMQLANDILNMGGKSQDALYEALVQGDEEMAEFIFRRYNVDLEHAEVLQDPLIVRMAEKSAKGVEWLLNHGASLSQRGIHTVVSAAANNGQVEVLEMLAQKGLKMDGGFEDNEVFFHPNSVQKLIELGAKVNEKTLSRALRLLGSQIGNKEKFSAVEESFHIIERAL